jgi:sensor histidine kinase YesM
MLHRAEYERQLTETELKLLQAQIEPHFLFNTLSNVLQLVDGDPRAAKRMLVNLTSYLRASLQRTRTGATMLGEELDLVRAYLEIQAERMGARLAWCIDCAPELRGLPLPPLLLQPLVENAVRHGLEPSRGGGEVRVLARREADVLVLEVQDTGVGIGAGSGSGVGLANIRARVRAVSQGEGRMVIQSHVPHGLCVRIALPLAGEADARRTLAEGAA